MHHPEMVKGLLADSSEAVTSMPEGFRKHIAPERERLTRVIKLAGIRGE
jgi:hypothetical protein